MDNRPVLLTTRLTMSTSKVNVFHETEDWRGMRRSHTLMEPKYPQHPAAVRTQIDKNNLIQLKGFEMNLKRKVAERYGGSYRDLTSVSRKTVSHHKSVQTLCTAASTSDLRVRDTIRRRPRSADMSHTVIPSHKVIIREEQLWDISIGTTINLIVVTLGSRCR